MKHDNANSRQQIHMQNKLRYYNHVKLKTKQNKERKKKHLEKQW